MKQGDSRLLCGRARGVLLERREGQGSSVYRCGSPQASPVGRRSSSGRSACTACWSNPYVDDHGLVWICSTCHAWIGVRPRSRHQTPLGRLANADLRDAKKRLHDTLEPLVTAKVRRDGVNAFEARGKAIKWLAGALGMTLSRVGRDSQISEASDTYESRPTPIASSPICGGLRVAERTHLCRSHPL